MSHSGSFLISVPFDIIGGRRRVSAGIRGLDERELGLRVVDARELADALWCQMEFGSDVHEADADSIKKLNCVLE
ncbi:hypothetical protein GCM10027052_13480 [Parafrigoribacterium mesophilum]|uniref:hypothetical protein n=1 Tax=Parafrigoribacterium mesophilum TaxID=433646 RepID=UPI0031FCFA82